MQLSLCCSQFNCNCNTKFACQPDVLNINVIWTACHPYQYAHLSICRFTRCTMSAVKAQNSDAANANATASVSSEPTHHYIKPAKQIVTPAHVLAWQRSSACFHLQSFITQLSALLPGTTCTQSRIHRSNRVDVLISWLQSRVTDIKSFPPIPQNQRFGNKAFRQWHAHMTEQISALHVELMHDCPTTARGAEIELQQYLIESFGSSQRIDYGTGHELNFMLYLLALYRVQLFTTNDLLAVALLVFSAYLNLTRALQLEYWLEPAGSKGAWGLDDYAFLPFLLGSAQLQTTDIPNSILLDVDAVKRDADEYLFFGAMAFVYRVKTGPVSEHSVYLYQISQAAGWRKVHAGLLRMYADEVLNKYPVLQHIYFGTILTLEPHTESAKR